MNATQRAAVLLVLGSMAGSANAQIQQACFSQPGTYLGVTVTQTGTGCVPFGPLFYGISDWAILHNSSCQLNFSPAVPKASVKVRLGDVNFDETISFEINGSAYAVQPADLNNVTTPPTPAGVLSLTGNNVTGDAGAGGYGNGAVGFSNAPGLISSVKVTESTQQSRSTVVDVCITNAPAPVPVSATVPVPALSTWGKIAASLLLMLGAAALLRRRT